MYVYTTLLEHDYQLGGKAGHDSTRSTRRAGFLRKCQFEQAMAVAGGNRDVASCQCLGARKGPSNEDLMERE